ncbi:hypothetical protein O9929_00255 [Vibrio lentus]|nr:hypothetical protein [Vibrio lentus]
MQWIIEHQATLIAVISGALVSGAAVGWVIKQKFSFSSDLNSTRVQRLLYESQATISAQIFTRRGTTRVNELDDD